MVQLFYLYNIEKKIYQSCCDKKRNSRKRCNVKLINEFVKWIKCKRNKRKNVALPQRTIMNAQLRTRDRTGEKCGWQMWINLCMRWTNLIAKSRFVKLYRKEHCSEILSMTSKRRIGTEKLFSLYFSMPII